MVIVLVPGLLCERTVWGHQLAAFSGEHEVLVADSSGAGTIAGLARAALALTDGDGLAVVGHSLGGRIALEMVRQAPGRIARLAVLDTGVHPARAGEAESRDALVQLGHEQGMAAVADAWLAPMLHPDRRDDAALVAPLRAMVERATPESFARQQHALLTRPDARPVLATTAVPTLVLVGADDTWSPVAQHREIAAAVAGSHLVVVEHCGHMSTVEQPEAVTTALRQWLAR